MGSSRLVAALVVVSLLILLGLCPTVSSEDVGDGLDISFSPDHLELAYREMGAFNITINNSNDHRLYVRIVHFATKSPEGSATWIDPDILEVPAGGSNTSRVTVQSNSRGREGSGVSDVHLAFNWSTVVDDDFMNEEWYDWKWEYTYDIVDRTGESDDAYSAVVIVIVVIVAAFPLVILYIGCRRRTSPGENN